MKKLIFAILSLCTSYAYGQQFKTIDYTDNLYTIGTIVEDNDTTKYLYAKFGPEDFGFVVLGRLPHSDWKHRIYQFSRFDPSSHYRPVTKTEVLKDDEIRCYNVVEQQYYAISFKTTNPYNLIWFLTSL